MHFLKLGRKFKKIKKTIISTLIILSLLGAVLLVFPTVSYAASGTCGDNLTWNLSGDTLTISGSGAMKNYSSYSSAPWYSSGTSIKKVVIGDKVTSIGSYAFYNCSRLTKVNITDLSAWCKIGFGNEYANPLYYAHNLYLNDKLITNLEIPNDITEIRDYAFYGCSGLTSIDIPNSVTSIGRAAFNGCSNLTEITLPFVGASRTASGSAAVFGYIFGTSSYTGGTRTEQYSSSYSIYYIPSKLKKVTITDTTTIPYGAFYGCSGLTSITIPNSVTSIGDYAFEYCSRLTSITIPNSVTSIGYDAFIACYNLTKVNITDLSAWCKIEFDNEVANPLVYSNKLYLNDELITNLIIPEGVTEISDYAFYVDDSKLNSYKSINLPSTLKKIGKYAFYKPDYNSSNADINIFFNGTPLKWSKISIGSDNNVITASPRYFECLYFENNDGLWYYRGEDIIKYCGDKKEVTVPSRLGENDISRIGEKAFSGKELTKVKISEGISEIDGYAFENCRDMLYLYLPKSLKSVDTTAFSNCYNLYKIFYPGTKEEYNAISGTKRISSYASVDCEYAPQGLICTGSVKENTYTFNIDIHLEDIEEFETATIVAALYDSKGNYLGIGTKGITYDDETAEISVTSNETAAYAKIMLWDGNGLSLKPLCANGTVSEF